MKQVVSLHVDSLFVSSAMIGLLYPCIDSRLGEPHKFKREWSSVMRCVAVFVGINHASAVSFSLHSGLVCRCENTAVKNTNSSDVN